MAKGSRRSLPTSPMLAAVVSDEAVAPRKTPWSQSSASVTRGTTPLRRPPKMKISIGTPSGFSQSELMAGHWAAGAVKRALGCAAGSALPGDQSRPFQSIAWAGAGTPIPSHQISPSSVSAQLVRIVFSLQVSIAIGFD